MLSIDFDSLKCISVHGVLSLDFGSWKRVPVHGVLSLDFDSLKCILVHQALSLDSVHFVVGVGEKCDIIRVGK